MIIDFIPYDSRDKNVYVDVYLKLPVRAHSSAWTLINMFHLGYMENGVTYLTSNCYLQSDETLSLFSSTSTVKR